MKWELKNNSTREYKFICYGTGQKNYVHQNETTRHEILSHHTRKPMNDWVVLRNKLFWEINFYFLYACKVKTWLDLINIFASTSSGLAYQMNNISNWDARNNGPSFTGCKVLCFNGPSFSFCEIRFFFHCFRYNCWHFNISGKIWLVLII